MDFGGTPPPQHRADWYPDPTGRFDFRYHNGSVWTGDVSTGGQRFLDSLNAVDPAAGQPPTRSRRATAAMVLGIASVAVGWVPFVFVLAAIAAVLALALGIPALRRTSRQQPSQRSGRGFALTGIVLAPVGLALCGLGAWLSVKVLDEVDRFTDIGDYSVNTTACAVDEGVATYSGTIENRSSERHSYHIVVHLRRPGTDNTLHVGAVDAEDVDAGTTSRWTGREDVDEDALDCVVANVTGPLPFGQS